MQLNPVERPAKFIFAIVYSCGMLFEIFLPAYFGSTLTILSENIPYDIFKSNWLNQTKRYKRAMRILVERALRPISLVAGGIFVMNLATMVKVII